MDNSMYESPLLNAPYMCEESGCPKKATVEWMARDDEGDVYYTFKCDNHPERDPDQIINELIGDMA